MFVLGDVEKLFNYVLLYEKSYIFIFDFALQYTPRWGEVKSDLFVMEYGDYLKMMRKLKEMQKELGVIEDEKLKLEMENRSLISQLDKTKKERDAIQEKYERFDVNKRKVKNKELKRKKRLVRGRYREIVREYHETKTIKEIYEMCRERGYTGTYNTMRLGVLDFEIEQYMKAGLNSLEIWEKLREKRPKSKVTVETVEKIMKSLIERKGKR